MKKEFIKKVRQFLSGEPLYLTEIIQWLAYSRPRLINIKENRKLKYLLKEIQLSLFIPELPSKVVKEVFKEEIEMIKTIEECYYSVSDCRDWRMAISKSMGDPTKLSYLSYKNIEKYKIKIYYIPNVSFGCLYLKSDLLPETQIFLRRISEIRTKAKPTTVLNFIIEHLYQKDKKRKQEVTDFVSYFFFQRYSVSEICEVEGEKIKDYYLEFNYEYPVNDSELWNSCMRYEECSDFLNIYCDNPEFVKLLVAKNSNEKVLGRVLIWFKDGKGYYDKIYAYNSSIKIMIEEHAKNKGYVSIKSQKIFLPIKYKDYDLLPYLDSMCFFTKEGIQNYDSKDVICKFQSSEGESFLYSEDYEEINGRYYDKDDLYYSTYNDVYYLKEECEEAYYNIYDTSYFLSEDVVFSELEGKYLYRYSLHVVYLEYCGEYVFESNCEEDKNGILRYKDHVVFSNYENCYLYTGDNIISDPQIGWVSEEVYNKIIQQNNETVAE